MAQDPQTPSSSPLSALAGPPPDAEGAKTGSNVPIFSVGELSNSLKRTVEDAYGFVRVRGEISQPKQAASGHIYMTLKDDQAVIDGVCWRGAASKLSVRPEEGLEVICTGRLTTYPGRSKYQIVIESMEMAGEGALLKMLEERKRKLAAEGLFDAERKKPIPFLPTVIGVVTSPTGAVIRDILHRLQDRFPRHVLLWPAVVQGPGAAEQVTAAINGFNALPESGGKVPRPDLIIVARGGGSLEDLMAFNEENVVRAAAASSIPLISAVGHETDTTLIDFASDQRAPTPTAAAEMAVPVRSDLIYTLRDAESRLDSAARRHVERLKLQLEGMARGLVHPRQRLETEMQRLDQLDERLRRAGGQYMRDRQTTLAHAASRLSLKPMQQAIAQSTTRVAEMAARLEASMVRDVERRGERLTAVSRQLEAVSHKSVLDRGYVMVADEQGVPITKAASLSDGQAVDLNFADGVAKAVVGSAGAQVTPSEPKQAEVPTKPAAKPAKPVKKPASPGSGGQGSLF
ncbi:MAG: exodeoxyribonuclease VII large subunit [Alphaproteobacteria bacterium]|nr:exodeoxyribonuclease VII large subunit [Alphaproteobacteria bacterium]MAS46493.1 exodeoxyribonuclease VII large subunit [Alphaproteobacteria bacterium]MAX94587.1 exodeoxyribonuclease VII large subunit [Alphaproteobacteria bacterium]MBN54539.1 exodeoxyribonuclease VII large subunit [Alphaproteobacteria bacterium]OUT41912.1 MAG: exodeoxyribonuclease VII large subunit [Micavibrio sp. TMED2]